MAQAGYTPISLYFSTTAAAVPTSGNLANGELGINIQDEKLYFKNAAGTVKLLASNATSAPVLTFSAGTTGFTPSTATSGAVTLAGTLITSNGGTGLSSYTAGDLSYYASGTALTKLAIGTAGQFLTSTGTAPQWSTLSGVAVTTFSAGTTGFTPNTATSGAITLAGTLATTNGGTGLTSFTSGGVVYASSSSALATGSALTFDGTSAVSIGTGGTGSVTARITLSGSNANNYGAQILGQRNGSSTWILGDTSSILGGATTGLTYYVYGDTPFIWYNGGTSAEQMRLTSTGLGIGTNNPLTKLQVNSTAPTIRIEETTTGGSKRLELGVTSGGQAFIGATQSAQSLVLQTVGVTRMTIGSTGNVDIAASGNLDVNNGYVRAGGGSDSGTQLVMYTTAGGDGYLAAFQTIFATGSNSARTERMRITNTGRITINNTEYTCINGSVNGKTPAGTGFSFGYNPSGGSGESQLVWGTGGSTYPFVIAAYDGSTTSNIARFTTTGNFSLGNNGFTNATGYKIFDVSAYGSFGQRTTGNSDVFMAWNAYALSNNSSKGSGYGYKNTGDVASLYTQNGQHTWYAAGSGTAGGAISFTTLLTLNENGVLALSGGSTTANGVGVAFPSTQSASSDANTLDDYEEGSFTPVVAGGGTVGTATYNNQVGRYVKVGSMVTCSLHINYTGGTGTGSLNLGGLPFAAGVSNLYPPVTLYFDGVTYTAGSFLQGYTSNGQTKIECFQVNGGVSSVVTYDSTGIILANITYFV